MLKENERSGSVDQGVYHSDKITMLCHINTTYQDETQHNESNQNLIEEI